MGILIRIGIGGIWLHGLRGVGISIHMHVFGTCPSFCLYTRNIDLSGISVIEMLIQSTLDIMSTRHNISGIGTLTPLGVGTTVTRVTKVTMGT